MFPSLDAVGVLVAMLKDRDWLKWIDQEVHQVSHFSCQKIEFSDYRTPLCRLTAGQRLPKHACQIQQY